MGLKIIILAAGQGTRMKSNLPKVLHRLGGKSMLQHVIDSAKALSPEKIIIVHGPDPALLKVACPDPALTWVCQETQRGTGDAVSKAVPHLMPDDIVLVLYSDVPLITPQTLQALLAKVMPNTMGLLTVTLSEPSGFGRIIRHDNQVVRIVEDKDATFEEKGIQEINTGVCALRSAHLKEWLGEVKPNNAQNEYYLTDIVGIAVKQGFRIETEQPQYPEEVQGVNDRIQLAKLNQFYQHQQAEKWLKAGVGIVDPTRFQCRANLKAEVDVEIDVNVIFEGTVVLHRNATIGPNCYLKDCEIGENVQIRANSYLEGVTVGNDAVIGPFARLRPGTQLADKVRIGNFVEVKNAKVDIGSKINHLTYVGDASIGKDVNIGAGTITCNYDGVNKHQTIIEDGVHIGSNTQLVAPIRVGKEAVIAAGSTIVKDVPPYALTLTHRLDQRSQPRKNNESPKGSSESRS